MRDTTRRVVLHSMRESGVAWHEGATHDALAARLARLLGYEYGGQSDAREHCGAALYVVPDDTLTSVEAARLGVANEADLFGGVVDHRVLSTKAITHPLYSDDDAPEGWAREFAECVRPAVLRGYTAFSFDTARAAGIALLAQGAVRLKPCAGIGGRGQCVAHTRSELEVALAQRMATLAEGLVLETDLTDVATHSVGQIRISGKRCSYYGSQRLTTDNAGALVYGGSELLVARGDYDALLALVPDPAAREAIAKARLYDHAADMCLPGFYASRRNYDVAEGRRASDGAKQIGVLEQSWRIGGASGAEVAALELFSANPALAAVRAWTVEVYSESEEPPPGAMIYFRGIDPAVGPMTKYSGAEPYGDA